MEIEVKYYNIATLHLGVKPYACTMCDKRFFQRYHLTRHSLIHLGMRPHTVPMSLRQTVVILRERGQPSQPL